MKYHDYQKEIQLTSRAAAKVIIHPTKTWGVSSAFFFTRTRKYSIEYKSAPDRAAAGKRGLDAGNPKDELL